MTGHKSKETEENLRDQMRIRGIDFNIYRRGYYS